MFRSILKSTLKTGPIIRTQGFHTTVPSFVRVVPATRPDVQSVEEFLTKIGHGCEEHVDVFENDWEKFWNMTSAKMKDAGISIQDRKYILEWRERYLLGRPLHPLKIAKKKHGGERMLTQYLQEKLVKDRGAEAKKRKLYKKSQNLEIIEMKKLEKLHK